MATLRLPDSKRYCLPRLDQRVLLQVSAARVLTVVWFSRISWGLSIHGVISRGYRRGGGLKTGCVRKMHKQEAGLKQKTA